MPLFGKSADTTGSSWEPEAAAGRLAHTFGADPTGVFTSDLSVSEYVLLGEAGFEPFGFVDRIVDLPHRPAGREVVAEPGAAGAHPGHVQRPRARHGPDAGRGRAPRGGRHRRRAAADAGLCVGPGRPRVHRHRHRSQGDGPPSAGAHRAPDGQRVHVRLVGSGLLPPPGRRSGARGVRPRHVRVPHRPPVGLPGLAPDGTEPGNGDLHPGHLRGQGARPFPDAGRSRPGSGLGHRRRLGRASSTTSGASTRPSSSPRARRSAGSPTSTVWRTPRRSRRSRWGWTSIATAAHGRRVLAGAVSILLALTAGLALGARPAGAGLACDGHVSAFLACGEVVLPGYAWLGGDGVDVFSNGDDAGNGNSCGGISSVNGVVSGEEWQCVELIDRLYLTTRFDQVDLVRQRRRHVPPRSRQPRRATAGVRSRSSPPATSSAMRARAGWSRATPASSTR